MKTFFAIFFKIYISIALTFITVFLFFIYEKMAPYHTLQDYKALTNEEKKNFKNKLPVVYIKGGDINAYIENDILQVETQDVNYIHQSVQSKKKSLLEIAQQDKNYQK